MKKTPQLALIVRNSGRTNRAKIVNSIKQKNLVRITITPLKYYLLDGNVGILAILACTIEA